MANAKKELLDRLSDASGWYSRPLEIRCASIRVEDYFIEDKQEVPRTILLKEGYTQEEYTEFLNRLDFEYDAGYGLWYIHGTVWFNEPGLWMDRGEYDGSEWWKFNKCPDIPDNLKFKN